MYHLLAKSLPESLFSLNLRGGSPVILSICGDGGEACPRLFLPAVALRAGLISAEPGGGVWGQGRVRGSEEGVRKMKTELAKVS